MTIITKKRLSPNPERTVRMVTAPHSAWAQWWDHVSSIGDGYGRSHESQELEPQVSVKKESLQQLKVRTDLKGGSRLAAVACCTKTHHCAAFNFGAAVINPATVVR